MSPAHGKRRSASPPRLGAGFGPLLPRSGYRSTDVLELDVHATGDGEWVVSHDATVDRCTEGTGAIASMSWRELARLDAGFRFQQGAAFPFRGRGLRIPRLPEVLRAFPAVRLNIELKAGSPPALADLLRGEGVVARVCVGSESDELAAALHQSLPEACHFYPRDAAAAFVLAVKQGDEPPLDERFEVLDLPLYFHELRVFDSALRDAAARCGKWINVWTVDEPEEMRRLVAEGVGGIMTDRPDLLRQVLARSS
ncbi:MAG: glycerophosphodiester phosphodiesterase [Myxococcales bacterium]|nr:glycerophosphodiester phosphodiesterase [Myxococcales bacterium]